MARRMAMAVATRMLKRSISRAEAAPRPKPSARWRMLDGQPGPDQRRQGLAVAQAAHGPAAGGKDDGRGNHWSCQWAAARFIDADEEQLPVPGYPFPRERRARGHRLSPRASP